MDGLRMRVDEEGRKPVRVEARNRDVSESKYTLRFMINQKPDFFLNSVFLTLQIKNKICKISSVQ